MIKTKIINVIQKKNKGISLEQFINICLFDKEGYYKKSNPLGRSGDFTTSPEISQLFGEILGLYIFYLWQNKYKNKFNLIELGPGRGTLLIDILRITKSFSNFHNYSNIYLIEKNDYLIEIQKKNILLNKLEHLNLRWYKDFEKIDKKPSIIFANEFFDCFPIKQFQIKNNKWHEKIVNFNQKKKIFYYQNLLVKDSRLLEKLAIYNNNGIAELSEKRENYFRKICKYIDQSSGFIIIIDYGYNNFLKHFTLQSVFNHHLSNLFDNLGNQDITSFVDFKKMIDIAKNYNLHVEIFCNQKEFLLYNGILKRKDKIIKNCTTKQKKIIENECYRLIDEKQMGSIFKFLILSSKDINVKKKR